MEKAAGKIKRILFNMYRVFQNGRNFKKVNKFQNLKTYNTKTNHFMYSHVGKPTKRLFYVHKILLW